MNDDWKYDDFDQYLMPHEFLFLLPNTYSRIDLIHMLHKRDMRMMKKKICDYDLMNRNSNGSSEI
jgi:hypothetical protein